MYVWADSTRQRQRQRSSIGGGLVSTGNGELAKALQRRSEGSQRRALATSVGGGK